MRAETVEVLKLSLHGETVGYLAGYQSGRNIFVFDQRYTEALDRPTLTLTTMPSFPNATKTLGRPWITQQQLHPLFSNLLPEGAYREYLAQTLKVHPNNEFPLFRQLSQDLPGALVAGPLAPEQVPAGLLLHRDSVQPVLKPWTPARTHFSLAGVQMKFSMKHRDGRYLLPVSSTLGDGQELGDWIIKTPSTRHPWVPLNEYTAMQLARLAGVEIPEIRLVPLADLEGLPPINLPQETYAFAIRRFDRSEQQRIHTEDFAQILFKYPHEKYSSANYEQLGRILYRFTGRGLVNVQQLARRLLVNLLLANGDAHLKNWTLHYPDRQTPELAPAYDILTTKAYIADEQEASLNLGGTKLWYEIGWAHFEAWSKQVGVPWRAILPHLEDVLDKARTLWPQALEESPMAPEHKGILKQHWQALRADFQIQV